MDQGLAPCEALLDGQSVLPAHCYNASWEVGRLVLAPEYRAGPEVLKRCLFVTLLHLLRTTEIENVFAVCTPVLSASQRGPSIERKGRPHFSTRPLRASA